MADEWVRMRDPKVSVSWAGTGCQTVGDKSRRRDGATASAAETAASLKGGYMRRNSTRNVTKSQTVEGGLEGCEGVGEE